MLINLTASILGAPLPPPSTPASAMAARSPASSPRLPSPPPIAEDQIGPTSPGVSLYDEENIKWSGSHSISSGASRRIRPGTKAEDMAEGPPLVEIQEVLTSLTRRIANLTNDASRSIRPSN